MRIRTLGDLLSWLEDNAPNRAVQEAILRGRVRHLGGFTSIPPEGRPGWVTKVTTDTREYLLATVPAVPRGFRLYQIKEVPDSKIHHTGKELYDGAPSRD